MRWRRCPRQANVIVLASATRSLTKLVENTRKATTMGSPNPFPSPVPTDPSDEVIISQAWITAVGTAIATANSVLGPYIQQLVNGQQVQLDDADVSTVTDALAGLANIEPAATNPAHRLVTD